MSIRHRIAARIAGILVLAAAACCPSTRAQGPVGGPVALWHADGNADDSAGTNHLVLAAGVAYSQGHAGQAFDFPGKAGAVVSNSAPRLANVANSFTLSFWVHPRRARAETAESARGFAGLAGQQYAIFPDHGGFGAVGGAGAGVSVGTNGISVVEHREAYLPTPLVWKGDLIGWNHVAVVYDHYTPRLYVNGVLVRVGLDARIRSEVTPGDVFPGKTFGDPGDYGPFDGLLDEVACFDRALSDGEVLALARPRLINVNFTVDAREPKVGRAAAGNGDDDFWNAYSRDLPDGGYRNNGVLAPLRWSDGSESTAGLAVNNAAGAWPNGLADAMFGLYLYPLTGNPEVTVTATNVPDGIYDLYAYGHGGPPDNQNTVFNLSSAGTDYGDKATTQDASWRQPAWVEGAQYVVFRSVAVRADQPLVLVAKPGGAFIGIVNGLQLVQRSAAPIQLDPNGGLFTNRVLVRIVGATGRTVRYTTDGSAPLATSALYAGPIELRAAAVLQARVFEGDTPASPVFRAEFLRVYAVDDGIPAAWRLKFFGAGYATDPRVAADADPDNDGATNLQEFGNNTNPLDPLDGFAVGVRQIPSISWHSVSNVVYNVLRKDHLSDPAWITIQQVRAFGNNTTFSDEGVTDFPRYYLIQAVKP